MTSLHRRGDLIFVRDYLVTIDEKEFEHPFLTDNHRYCSETEEDKEHDEERQLVRKETEHEFVWIFESVMFRRSVQEPIFNV